jgi:hypothetical protein
MLGLAALAAMVAMAFVGASSASADETHIQLCEKKELVCESPLGTIIELPGGEFKRVAKIVAHSENPKLLSSIGTIECEKSLAEADVLNELSLLILGHFTGLSFEGNCHLGGTSCTVTVPTLGLLKLTKIGDLLASLLSTGGTEANVKCGLFINCTYGGEPLLHVDSLEDGKVHILANETELKKSKGICPSVSKWDANYLVLGTMWVES